MYCYFSLSILAYLKNGFLLAKTHTPLNISETVILSAFRNAIAFAVHADCPIPDSRPTVLYSGTVQYVRVRPGQTKAQNPFGSLQRWIFPDQKLQRCLEMFASC